MTRRILLLLLGFFLMTAPAGAAKEQKSFAVLPLKIHGPQDYKYLSQGAQSMLTTRLTWTEHFEPVPREKLQSVQSPESIAQARKTAREVGADYVIFGALTIMDKECNLDLKTVPREGGTTTVSRQTTLDNLIPELKSVAQKINAQVFNRPQKQKKASSPEKIKKMNPDLVYNKAKAGQEYYLNPQFKYSQSPDTPGRWRSQSLKYIGRNMVVCNADGKKGKEIFIIGKNEMHAYRMQERRMKPIATYNAPHTFKLLNLNFMDMNRDGYQELVVSAIQGEKTVRSFVLNFKDDKFEVQNKDIPFFLNVIKTPPEYMKTLIGQKRGAYKIFNEDSVYEMIKSEGEFKKGRHISVPEWGNVFNLVYLPRKDGYKIIVAHSDHLRVYSDTKDLQYTTDEVYAASSLRLKKDTALPGLNESKDARKRYYFLPTRLLPTNLDRDDRFELIVGRPLSVASQFFENYRTFPQGEIHSLYWDGVGLNIFWKTRRIKGTISDYGIYDLDNDDQLELVVCVNTYPGATGLKHRKTMLLAYNLDTESDKPTPKAVQPE